MERLPLKLDLQDTIKYCLKILGMPTLLGIALSVYLGYLTASNFIYTLPVFIGVFAVIVLFVRNIANLTLDKNGFTYPDLRGRKVPYLWHQPIEIDKTHEKATRTYSIRVVDNNAIVQVPKTIFSYPEVSKFISEFAPPNHKLRELI